MRKYQICSNCVMDTSDSRISFDESGVCDHCNTFFKDIKPYWNQEKGDPVSLNGVMQKMKK